MNNLYFITNRINVFYSIFKFKHYNLCDGIKDVSKLGSVNNLNLSGCYNISDVSMLGNVNTLNISGCLNISDISKLNRLYNLNL